MNTNKDDQMISKLVCRVDRSVPPAVKRELKKAIYKTLENRKTRMKRIFLSYQAAAIAVLLVISILTVIKPFTRPKPDTSRKFIVATHRTVDESGTPLNRQVYEIRSEFEIKKKKIKIIWFQRKTIDKGRKS